MEDVLSWIIQTHATRLKKTQPVCKVPYTLFSRWPGTLTEVLILLRHLSLHISHRLAARGFSFCSTCIEGSVIMGGLSKIHHRLHFLLLLYSLFGVVFTQCWPSAHAAPVCPTVEPTGVPVGRGTSHILWEPAVCKLVLCVVWRGCGQLLLLWKVLLTGHLVRGSDPLV